MSFNEEWEKIKLEEFAKIYTEAIKSKKIATPESLSFIINEDEISIITRIDIIKKTVEVEKRTRFTKLLSAGMNKLEIILIFLAMLELMRTGFLKVSQNDMFSDIIIEKKYNNIIILNALGSRLDHTMGNLFLLEKFKNINIKIIDNHSETFLVNEKEVVLKNKNNHILSIVPVSEFIQVKKLTGVKYPLVNKTVNRGSTLCISNIVNDKECLISISVGRAFIIITNNMEE